MGRLLQVVKQPLLIEVLKNLIKKHNPELEWVTDNLLFATVAGSKLYGTSLPTSDYDIRAITFAPRRYWVGACRFDQLELSCEPGNKYDFVVYDIRKWLQLTVSMNPNVLELLFVNPNDPNIILLTNEWTTWLQPSIQRMMNKKAFVAFNGYSVAQMKKMASKQKNKTGRQDIVKKHGFDTKFVAHAFRLLRQGTELLAIGKMTFPRPDFQNLLDIRNGLIYKPEDQERCFKEWSTEAKLLEEASLKSPLPEKFDFDAYNSLLESIFYKMIV